MTFGSCLSSTYGASWLFVRRAWWLVLGAFAGHLLVTLGLSSRWWPIEPAFMPKDWVLGFAATTVLRIFVFFVFMRFIGFGTDLARAFSVDGASVMNFLPFALALVGVWLAPWLALHHIGTIPALGVVFLLEPAVMFLFAPWAVAAPSGSGGIGPRLSVRHAMPQLTWGWPFMLVVFMPLGIFEAFAPEGGDGEAIFAALGDVVGMVVEPAAVFAAATKMGVRVSDPESVQRIFE